MRIINTIISFLGAIEILVSPTLFGAFFGFIVNCFYPSLTGIIIWIILILIGLILGIIWALKITQKEGTMEFMSRVSAGDISNSADNNKNKTNQNL